MKKYFHLFIFIIIMCLNNISYANTVEELRMDVYVENDGDAVITEYWRYSSSENTEIYHTYENLSNSSIRDLEVWRDGKKYETVSDWKINETFEYKKNKCGINKIVKGAEICWGIGEYGTHNYQVKYVIENFVKQLNDSQLIYWELITPNSEKRNDAKITIRSDKHFEDTTDVWGYGNYGGLAYVNNGCIEMKANNGLSSDEYMTVLVKLPIDMFNAKDEIDKNFEYYLQMAKKGSQKYINSDAVIGAVISTSIFAGIIICCVISNKHEIFSYTKKIKKKINQKDVEYYRDISCNKDIFKAYFLAYEYGIISKKTDVLGAIILKWIKEKRTSIQIKKVGMFKKKEEQCLMLKAEYENMYWEVELEKELYSMMYKASEDGILEKKELEKWSKRQYGKLFDWFDKLLNQELEKCVNNGEIKEIKKGTIFNSGIYEDTITIEQQARQICGLKKYLKEFSLINEREPIEVILFEEYLIYAQMLGIAKTVAKKFKDLYPELKDQISITYDDYMFTNDISSNAISSANSARESANSYSSGGGGYSSGGGGGGSFGGGGSSGSR